MRRILSAVAVGLTGAVVLSVHGTASAAQEHVYGRTSVAGVSALSVHGTAAAAPEHVYGPIAARLGSLHAKLNALHQHSSLTESDAQALYKIITTDICSLEKLNAEIQATTSKEQLASEKFDIYRKFRVYVLVGPQYDMTTAADAGAKAAADLQGQEPALLKDATTATKQAEYRNLVLNVNKLLGILPGIGPSLLAQTPFSNFKPVVALDGKSLARGIAALDKAEEDASLIMS